VCVKRRVFGKENKPAPRTSIIDLATYDRTGDFCRTAKVFRRKTLAGRLFASKRCAELWRGCRRRIHINVRLRLGLCLGLRRWRLLYDRRVAFLLLGWRIHHRGFFLLTSRKQCGSGQNENIFFHNGIELDEND
jgi:hypothetical protein